MLKFTLCYNQKKLKKAYHLNRVLNFMFGLFICKKGYASIINPKKILVIQSHLVGDLIMSVPLLKALRRGYPEAKIFLLANKFANELLENAPYIDEIITMNFPWAGYDYSLKNTIYVMKVMKRLRREKFDLAIDAQIDMRNAFLMYLAGARRRLGYSITGGETFLTDIPELPKNIDNLSEMRLSILNYLGIDTANKIAELVVTNRAQAWMDAYLVQAGFGGAKLVAVYPGASKSEKLWRCERFAEVIDYLYQKNYQPVLIEGPLDRIVVTAIVAKCKNHPPVLKTNLGNLVAFIQRCYLVICVDSASIHLAGAVNTPAIAIYGPKWPQLTLPFNNNIEAIWDKHFNCRPCEYGHCKNPGYTCMDAIQTKTVIDKIDKMLEDIQTAGNINAEHQ